MRLAVISGSILYRENNVLDKTPLIYHETKSSICCWYLIMYKEHCHLYVSEDHERIIRGYRKTTFAIFNIISKWAITKVIAE
jgi:hypothetical protein